MRVCLIAADAVCVNKIKMYNVAWGENVLFPGGNYVPNVEPFHRARTTVVVKHGSNGGGGGGGGGAAAVST